MSVTTAPQTIATTVEEIEAHWGHNRDEWGFYGPEQIADETSYWFELDNAEDVEFEDATPSYRIEQEYEDGLFDVASDQRFGLADIPPVAVERARA